MIKHKILILILVSLFAASCSQGTKKTAAKLKLNLSGITNVSNGIGSGGILLFGKSSTGEQFGKIISSSEQELELPNGDWSFYAMMWAKSSSYNFNDTIYCGKSTSKLSGTATSVALNLTNAICSDADFSAGKSYTDYSGKVHMSNFLLDECDDLNASNALSCKKDNEGSALSYRMIFKSYKKAANGVVTFEGDSLSSACVQVSGGSPIYSTGMYMNFPVSSQAMPFIMSAEMFMGTTDCGNSVVDAKGVYTHTFLNGLNEETSAINKKSVSTGSSCSYSTFTQASCVENKGYWNGTDCQFSDLYTSPFIPVASCTAPVTLTATYVKQMVTIPKEFLCRNVNAGLTGTSVFPAGNGTANRPYKICNEWQLNNISEAYNYGAMLSASSFKLMNDLDMNVTDFNVALKPSCMGQSGSALKKHHNLNPLDLYFSNGCDPSVITANNSFTGDFNGNNKTIANGRIYVDTDNIGFVRKLGANGYIRNLNFKNLEVEGNAHVGLIAGAVPESYAQINNIKIKGGYAEGDGFFVGGVAGEMASLNTISNVSVVNAKIHGTGKVGGLVGHNDGTIRDSMFRGDINQYSLIDDQVGGLVGLNGSSSNIYTSFSEGRILSYAKYTGGIAGHNMGLINNTYSTMFIQSRFGTGADSVFVGGVAASNESGTISNVYFDGVLKYDGSTTGTVVMDGISAYASTPSTCYTSTNNVSASSCIYSATLRSGSIFVGNSSWVSGISGGLPRLTWEQANDSRPCLATANYSTISNQKSAGRGSLTNPLTICSPDQLLQFGTVGTNLNAVLMEDLNLSGWVEGSLIAGNTAVFDGQNHSLMGLNLNVTTGTWGGLIRNNTGKIMNLNLYGNIINSTLTGGTAVLAGVSSGTISGIKMAGNNITGVSYVGQVAGSQSGTIDDVVIEDSKMDGGSYVGGVAGSNAGSITRASVNAAITQRSGIYDYHKFGGITGMNSSAGVINQTSFGGNMNFTTASTNASLWAGGLVGYNQGTVKNSMVKNYASMYVKNATAVGGLLGLNSSSGKLATSFNTGRLIYNTGVIVPAGSAFSQLIGYNEGSLDTYSYYLEKKSGAYIGTKTINSACSGSSASFSDTTPSYLTFATPTADLMGLDNASSSGDSLTNLSSFSLSADYVTNFSGACNAGDSFSFYASFTEMPNQGKITIADFGSLSTFSYYDIAYDDGPTSGNSINYDRLMDYHKSRMNGVVPTLIPPIWIFEPGEYPRLVQLND